jgi:mRNA-degrading endonuclease RelE of RelBE toxin-antitoxin system
MPTEAAPITLSYSAAFLRQLKRLNKKYRRIRADLQPVLEELQTGATPGDQVQGSGYVVYKVRLANSDAQRGTSGGYRVLYYVQTQSSRLLLAIYSKTEQSDIAVDDIRRIVEAEIGG